MPFRKSKPWGNTKPPVGYGIDWGDPINMGLRMLVLANEGAGNLQRVLPNFMGTNSVVTWTPGKFGVTSSYNASGGTTSKTTILYTPWLNPTVGISLSAWVYFRTGNAGGLARLLDSGNVFWGIENAASKQALFVDASNQQTASTAVPTNVWTHLAVTYDLAVFRFYLNGKADGTASFVRTMTTNAGSFIIGNNGASTRSLDANIENMRMYCRALKAGEIWRLYSEPFAGVAAPRRRIISQSTAVTNIVPRIMFNRQQAA